MEIGLLPLTLKPEGLKSGHGKHACEQGPREERIAGSSIQFSFVVFFFLVIPEFADAAAYFSAYGSIIAGSRGRSALGSRLASHSTPANSQYGARICH